MSDNWYDRHILPHFLDIACGLRPVRRRRDKVVPLAEGRVLEVGIGTGLNMRHYDKFRVTKIIGLDPALQIHRLALKRIARAGLDVELVGLSAEKSLLTTRASIPYSPLIRCAPSPIRSLH